GDYSNAYKTQQTAFNMTPGSDTTLKTLNLYFMSTLFLGAGLPELALKQLQKILTYYPGDNIQDMIAKKPDAVSALVIGGEAYLQLGMLDSAKKIIDLLGTPQADLNIFHNIFWGRYHTAVKEYGKALPPLQQGLDLAIQFNQPLFISKLHIEVAKVYLGMKNYKTALQHAEQGLKAAENIHALLEMTAAAGTLSEIYDGLKIYDKAYFYSKQEKAYHDSLISEEDKRKIALLQVEKDLADQKRESELLAKNAQLKEQQLQRESLIKNIVIAGLLVFIIFAIVAIRNIALQRRNEKLRHRHQLQIKQFENENAQAKLQKHASDLEMQALRAQMNPHFIFNCLNAINHFIQKNETETASDYLTKFSRLIRMVLQSSSHKYISLHDELETLNLYIGMESVRFKDHFSYSIQCDPKVDIESVQIPPMLLQPFVENAIWHGLMHKKDGGKLSIEIKEEDDTLVCTIQDNGIGRKKAAELKSKSASYKKSMGMQITENRLKMLYKGHGGGPAMKIVDLENEYGEATGTKIILRLPVKLHEMAEEEI
ncbi:MAG TPA: histidine kinase, partial [Chitinophagaceae bacterium]